MNKVNFFTAPIALVGPIEALYIGVAFSLKVSEVELDTLRNVVSVMYAIWVISGLAFTSSTAVKLGI